MNTEKTTSKFTYQQQVLSLPQLCLSYSFCDTVMNKPSHANQFLLPGYGCYYIVVPIPFDRYTLIPDFVRLLRAQVPLKTIYEVRHQDEILGGAMQYTAQKVAAKVAAGVSANRGRPAENGAAASGASGARFDVEHSTKEQRMALIRRAANGERIEF